MGDRVGADRRATSFQLIPAAVTERLAVGGWLLNSRAILHPALAPLVVKFDGRTSLGKKLSSYGFRQQPLKTSYVCVFVCMCIRVFVQSFVDCVYKGGVR